MQWAVGCNGHGGTYDSKIILELVRYCRRLGKWEELQYLELFLKLGKSNEEPVPKWEIDQMLDVNLGVPEPRAPPPGNTVSQTQSPVPRKICHGQSGQKDRERMCPLVTEVVG